MKVVFNRSSAFQIVPFTQSDVDLMVSTFRALTDEVRRNIPDVLLASMTILVRIVGMTNW